MPSFLKFKRKRKPDRPLTAWNARVIPTLKPSRVTVGRNAIHSVDVHNLDEIYRYEVTINATCLGKYLRYGTEQTWQPETKYCDPRTSVEPIAFAEVGVPLGAEVPAGTEQIDMKITLVRADPQRKPVIKSRVFTLHLGS